jgi:hypothetical protein
MKRRRSRKAMGRPAKSGFRRARPRTSQRASRQRARDVPVSALWRAAALPRRLRSKSASSRKESGSPRSCRIASRSRSPRSSAATVEAGSEGSRPRRFSWRVQSSSMRPRKAAASSAAESPDGLGTLARIEMRRKVGEGRRMRATYRTGSRVSRDSRYRVRCIRVRGVEWIRARTVEEVSFGGPVRGDPVGLAKLWVSIRRSEQGHGRLHGQDCPRGSRIGAGQVPGFLVEPRGLPALPWRAGGRASLPGLKPVLQGVLLRVLSKDVGEIRVARHEAPGKFRHRGRACPADPCRGPESASVRPSRF